jgi:hypothetical protein
LFPFLECNETVIEGSGRLANDLNSLVTFASEENNVSIHGASKSHGNRCPTIGFHDD